MSIFQRILPWLLCAGFCAVAAADEVVLKNGSKIEAR